MKIAAFDKSSGIIQTYAHSKEEAMAFLRTVGECAEDDFAWLRITDRLALAVDELGGDLPIVQNTDGIVDLREGERAMQGNIMKYTAIQRATHAEWKRAKKQGDLRSFLLGKRFEGSFEGLRVLTRSGSKESAQSILMECGLTLQFHEDPLHVEIVEEDAPTPSCEICGREAENLRHCGGCDRHVCDACSTLHTSGMVECDECAAED